MTKSQTFLNESQNQEASLPVIPAAKPAPRVQTGPAGQLVTIIKAKHTNARAFRILPLSGAAYYVPLEIAALCVGKDAWMKDLTVHCSDCKGLVHVGDLECDLCPECYDAAGEANRISDEGEN